MTKNSGSYYDPTLQLRRCLPFTFFCGTIARLNLVTIYTKPRSAGNCSADPVNFPQSSNFRHSNLYFRYILNIQRLLNSKLGRVKTLPFPLFLHVNSEIHILRFYRNVKHILCLF